MEELVQRLDFLLNFLRAGIVHFLCLLAAALLGLLRLTGGTDGHVELSDLVSVLTWCWHFYRTGPVEVEVAEGVCQLLDVRLREG